MFVSLLVGWAMVWIALNLEWIGMGELNNKANSHWLASQLDLVGMNGVGLFYLAMRRGLDYLAANPKR